MIAGLAHAVAALVAIFAMAYVGRAAARGLRQPEVIGEICVGLLLGPVVVVLVGHDGLSRLLPAQVTNVVRAVGHAGLVLFLVGVAYELRRGMAGVRVRSVGWVATSAFVLPLAVGSGLALWLLGMDRLDLHGTAPGPAFVAMVAVALSVTAVPVLARILADRGVAGDKSGTLALGSAVLIDAVAWLLLSVVIGLAAGGLGGVLTSVLVSGGGVGIALVARRLLAAEAIGLAYARHPRLVVLLIGVLAVVMGMAAGQWGLTEILGPLLVGLAIPVDHPDRRDGAGTRPDWSLVARSVGGLGLRLVPAFFVVTGVGLFAGPEPAAVSWDAVVLVTAAAIVSKVGGGYLGARLAGHSRRTGLQVGALMNARGLTEIIVLQVGYDAGLLPPALYLAFLVMAVATTAATGPLLSIIDRISVARPTVRGAGCP